MKRSWQSAHATRVFLFALALAACVALPVHAQTSSEMVTLNGHEYSDWIHEPGSRFKCPNGKVLTGRQHKGSEEGETRYRCAFAWVRNVRLTFADTDTTPNFPEGEVGGEGDHWYVAPITWVWIGREHDGDENGPTRYNIAQPVTDRGEHLIQRFAGGWHSAGYEDDHEFNCPGENEVLVGRNHQGDEKGPSAYLCATLWTTPPATGIAGTMSLRNTKTEQPCTIDIPKFTGGIIDYMLTLHNDAAICPNDIHMGFNLTNVESSVRILVTDDDLCRKEKGQWWVEMRTMKNPTTTTLDLGVRFPELLLTKPGMPYTPGLLVLDRYRKEGDTTDLTMSLSCVRFTTSASPPTSSTTTTPPPR